MKLDARYTRTVSRLKRHNQQHLLKFWTELDNIHKADLLSQLEKLDLRKISNWIDKYVKNEAPFEIPSNFVPAPSYPACPKDDRQALEYQKACVLGRELLRKGRVAGFVVAGGRGTRLGLDGPKGNFPVSPIRKKTLFRIFGETILAASGKYQTELVWYVMTSPINYTGTCQIFEEEGYFGLDKKNIFIFCQGTMPNFDFDGKILLKDKCTIASSPDGHGGSLKALADSGALDDMKRRGIEYLSYWQVDNPLANLFDPLFIGLHVLKGSQMSSKALVKSHPTERVGNFCTVDGKVAVIEYSDLSEERAHLRNPDGSLVFELGSIGVHVISVSFVEKLNAKGDFALPFHRAVKKIPYIDSAGNYIEPANPNGVKLETFVFDALPLAENSIILQTVRSEEFAPVKNATGPDSPDGTCRMMIERAAAWLEKTGIKIPRRPDGSVDCVIEIAPSFALSLEDLQAKADKIPPISTGDKVYLA